MKKTYIYFVLVLLSIYNTCAQDRPILKNFNITISDSILIDLSKPDSTFTYKEDWDDKTLAYTFNEKSDFFFTFKEIQKVNDISEIKSCQKFTMTSLFEELKIFVKHTLVAPDYAPNWNHLLILNTEVASIQFSNVYVKMLDQKIYKVHFSFATVLYD
ncbi:hypothetical protein [Myroides marinus]|uniref:hypothetical protein n=1 Tax=Myroides marinus TaxID=703342 RepID=UPI000741EE76|nr:hypothetical protein [Myroides marinus]KUF43944.1 hypothetical protein AS361_04765 [Myroides marinus]MDM1349727.1 hypothetical protein [Myroides marinus]MDM1356936.1 hypothetical protein [Myroides marinus]MDM1361674.1 hypothetical protein [Myroides marinus]MDM1376233.1 hypothetical protein [Myroides marinus]